MSGEGVLVKANKDTGLDGGHLARATRYKVVETQVVTDEDLEEIINDWVGAGWLFDGIQFAMRESSKRPAMAFVVFTRRERIDESAG